MAVTLLDMPLSTPEYVSHEKVLENIQKISAKHSVDDVTIYGAKVEEVRKLGAKWVVKWTTAPKHNENGNGNGHFLEMEHQSVG